MPIEPTPPRREFLSASAGAAFLLAGCAGGAPRDHTPESAPAGEEEVTPGEDLMREHGVLRRILFVYDEVQERLVKGDTVPLDLLGQAAGMIRSVVEDYHEKLEEELVFPRFEQAGKHTELVAVLRRQHAAGRAVTEFVQGLCKSTLKDDTDRAALGQALRAFNRMYRPHAAREDTVLLPALRGLLGGHAYEELGEQFEAREKALLGAEGFEHAVAEIARIEAGFGLDDLARFTAS